MKPFRRSLLAAGIVVVAAGTVLAVAFSSTFQTWLARRLLANQPGMRATVGLVSAGLRQVEVRDLRIEQEGTVLTVPQLTARLPLISAALRDRVQITKAVARNWVLEFGPASPAAASAPAPLPPPPGGPVVPPAQLPEVAAKAFAGVFAELRLPVDLSVDGLELDGEIVLPASRGRAKVTLNGGGLAAGQEGRFALAATAALADRDVSGVEVRGELAAAMDTPRSFTRLAATLDAAARGARFPQGVKVTAQLAATRAGEGEAYSVAVFNEGGEILTASATYPRDGDRLDGTWKVDLRDADVAPFALGQPLPAFTAVGQGKFDADPAFAAVHVTGRLNATADRLQVVQPELAALGELKVSAEFDLAERGGAFVVQTLQAAVSGAQPVATVRTLQAFDFNPATGELRASDATRELLGIVVHGVPLAWAKPFVPDLSLEGGDLRGEFVATARGGGGALRSTTPITLERIDVARAGTALLTAVDVSLNLSADYTPKGWQAEISGLTARSAGAVLLSFDAKAGQLAGIAQPVKATGKLTAALAPLLAQPAAHGALVLSDGQAAVDFVATLNRKHELQAKVALTKLVAPGEKEPLALPAVTAELRADVAPDGAIAFNAPLVIERESRKSDLTLAGTLSPLKDNSRGIDAQVTSRQLIVDDAAVLAAMLPPEAKPAAGQPAADAPADAPAAPAAAPAPRPAAPPWAGFHGAVALKLGRVVYSDTFEVIDMGGRLRIDAGTVKLELLQAGLGDTGRAEVSGALTFDAAAARPFGLTADVAVKQFDPGPLLRAFNGDQPPTIEGKFDVTSKLASRGATLESLVLGAGGDFHLTSRGGVFRGLPVSVANITENTGRIAAWLATAGSAIGSIAGKKEQMDVASKSQAVAELAKGLNPIPYDQLSLVLSRDAGLNTTIRDFVLIAPEMRLAGNGTVLHTPGASLLDGSLAMEFTLRARGRQGDLLKYLGALEPQPDDLGYSACTFSLRVGGSLEKPDTTELSQRLVALALEKGGVADRVSEKASELFNKVFGGAK